MDDNDADDADDADNADVFPMEVLEEAGKGNCDDIPFGIVNETGGVLLFRVPVFIERDCVNGGDVYVKLILLSKINSELIRSNMIYTFIKNSAYFFPSDFNCIALFGPGW